MIGYASWEFGIAWVRWHKHGPGWSLGAPWKDSVFSERMGIRRPVLRLFGWRVFRLPPFPA